jgi:nitric oxide reductase activation protein
MPPLGPVTPTDARVEKMQKDLAKQENTDRQKKLVADTAKLLELANELKAAVDKSNKDTLSLDVVRKADAIEKLAHSVKEGMKGN